MKNLAVIKKLVLTVLVFTFLIVASPVMARSISISPLKFRFESDPGETVDGELLVMNSSDEAADVEMVTEQMEPQGEEGGVSLIETEDVDEDTLEVLSIAHWIDFEPGELSLEPGEEKTVDFTAEVPKNATPGGHYVALIAGTPEESQVEAGGVGINHRVASTLYLTVGGEMKLDLSAVDFETDKNYYGETEETVTFTSRFENEGTVHVSPEAEIKITDLRGNEVDKLEVKNETVLPGAVRKIETDWKPDGLLWGGKYEAELTGVYGEDGKKLGEMSTSFYAFPWKYGLAAILVLIFFILTRKRWITIFKILVKGEAALKDKEE